MALSNWLTRTEWNIAYFAGLVNERKSDDLGGILIGGLVAMHKAGWIFEGIDIDNDGNYTKINQCCAGNEMVLAELINGSFSPRQRAEEAIAYVDAHFPAIDLSEIKKALKEFEEG
jgi:hypothetical protein